MIVAGYFFKLLVANNLNEISYMAFPLYETCARRSLAAGDPLQLPDLSDFFGYSAIALGLGLLFGYRLPVNFNLPYKSASFSEFWTRWHISLSNWLKTYLYIPLGGNRHGTARTYLNLMIVMTLGGLWHGASLSYALWGLLHGLLLVIERPLLALFKNPGPAVQAVRAGVVFFCVTMLWIFFKLPDFSHALGYLHGMFVPSDNQVRPSCSTTSRCYSLPVIIQHLGFGGFVSTSPQRWEPYLYGVIVGARLSRRGADARLHLLPVLSMKQSPAISWFIKCALMAALVLLADRLAVAIGTKCSSRR